MATFKFSDFTKPSVYVWLDESTGSQVSYFKLITSGNNSVIKP